jgi:hypothetical protein
MNKLLLIGGAGLALYFFMKPKTETAPAPKDEPVTPTAPNRGAQRATTGAAAAAASKALKQAGGFFRRKPQGTPQQRQLVNNTARKLVIPPLPVTPPAEDVLEGLFSY